MSTVWKPVGTNLMESPTWIVVPCGKKSLASAKAFWNSFCDDNGVPMSTVLVAALALAGMTASAAIPAARAAVERCDKGAPLGRNYVVFCRCFCPPATSERTRDGTTLGVFTSPSQ
jgi:hypothetical protein